MSPAAIHIETWGCSFNVSDSEVMAELLGRAGYRLTDCADSADLVLMNTCTVKDRTFRNFCKRLAQLRSGSQAVVVAGCIPKANEQLDELVNVSVIGPDTIAQLPEVVAQTLAGRVVHCLHAADGGAGRLELPHRRRNRYIQILPIARGCVGACTYCQTRRARGGLISFHPDRILEQARRAIAEGVVELWVTAQDVGAYGSETGWSLLELLDRLCSLSGNFRVRLGMSNPLWMWRRLSGLLDVLAHPKMFTFLHLPLQSGSDRVLQHMNRPNTVTQFLDICEAFHQRFPHGALMTDLIVGYPTETEQDFKGSLRVLRQARPAAVNRSKYSPRPGTPAAALRPHHSRVLAERSARLDRHVRRLARQYHRHQVGRVEQVLTEERRKPGTTLARNPAWRPVVLPGDWPLGCFHTVRHVGAADFHLCAVALDHDVPVPELHEDRMIS